MNVSCLELCSRPVLVMQITSRRPLIKSTADTLAVIEGGFSSHNGVPIAVSPIQEPNCSSHQRCEECNRGRVWLARVT